MNYKLCGWAWAAYNFAILCSALTSKLWVGLFPPSPPPPPPPPASPAPGWSTPLLEPASAAFLYSQQWPAGCPPYQGTFSALFCCDLVPWYLVPNTLAPWHLLSMYQVPVLQNKGFLISSSPPTERADNRMGREFSYWWDPNIMVP